MTVAAHAAQAGQARPCNLCASKDVETHLYLRHNNLLALRCRSCGMIYIGNNPVKDEDLSSLYTMDAFKGERHFQSKDWYRSYYSNCLAGYDPTSETIQQFEETLRQLKRFRPSGRLLDIGCATGVFLDRARKSGYEVTGIDVSPELADYARKKFDLDIHQGYLEEQNFADGSFDVITMLDVIEHIPQYDKLLPEIRRILKPGGILYLRTPSEDALMRYFAKALYTLSFKKFELPLLWFYSFEHVSSFNNRTLTLLIERYGFHAVHSYDESETPERLDIPRIVKGGLRLFEAVAGILRRRHKINIIAAPVAQATR